MPPMVWFHFVVATMIICLAGCSKPGAGPSGDPWIRATTIAELNGDWLSACADAKDFGIGELVHLSFSAGGVYSRVAEIGDSGTCVRSFAEVVITGRFSIPSSETQGMVALDVIHSSAVVKATSELGARILRLARFCGVTDWDVGVERNVMESLGSENCFQRISKSTYTLYAINNGVLFLGSGESFSNPGRRPVTVDLALPFHR